MKQVFFIDTDSELDYRIVDEMGFKLIRMPYILDGQVYLDDCGRDTDYDGFMEQIKKGKIAKTSSLNTNDYLMYFEEYFKNGDDIFYLHFSSEMSGSFGHMATAVKELSKKYPAARFRSLDSKSISMGFGYQCFYAGKMFQKGKSFDEIIEFLEGFKKHSCCFFVVDDIEYLRRGGRVSGLAAFAGKLLGIKPVLNINDEGKIVKFSTVRGKNGASEFLAKIVKERRIDDNYNICILYTSDGKNEVDNLTKKLNSLFPDAEVVYKQIGPVIGAHCGPGTLGIVFNGTHR